MTLSTNSAVESPIEGLLYVPDLDPNDECATSSLLYLPPTVTRQTNLPTTDYNIIALAPWINVDCTQSYLASANLDPIRAFIFYHPENLTEVPDSEDPDAWDLADGGAWKRSYRWPVYGVSGVVGQRMMAASSKYSGNMTSVPNGQNLSGRYDTRDYVRVYTKIVTTNTTSLPTLWIFLLVTVACLIVILTFTSLAFRWIQRQQRESLRRRVANGEVDLEALGIGRITVPKEYIDKMPLYIYTCRDDGLRVAVPRIARLSLKADSLHEIHTVDGSGHELDSSLPSPSSSNLGGPSPSPSDATRSSNGYAVTARNYDPGFQPTCPICHDEFESAITTIRELPCGHIFHPECIDSFLYINSSLCPLCERGVVPTGYCVGRITNAMVRRELMVRRIRSRVNVEIDDGDSASGGALRGRLLRLGRQLKVPLRAMPNLNLRPPSAEHIAPEYVEGQPRDQQASRLGIPHHQHAQHRVPQQIDQLTD